MATAKTKLRRRRAARPPKVVWLPALLVATAALLPLAYLLIRGLDSGAANFLEVVSDAGTLAVLWNSVLLAAIVTAGSVAVAVPLAWLTVRTDLPGRGAFAVMAALPLVIPSYVGGYVLISTLGPRGSLQGALEPFGVERLPEIYGLPGAAFALVLFTYPYVFLTTRAALRGLDPALEDMSRSLGRGAWATFFSVTLPQLRPAVMAGALLVSIYTLGEFGVVSLLRYDSFSRVIYLQYQLAFDRTPAAILALMLVALVAVILVIEAKSRGRARYFQTSGAARSPRTAALGRWKIPALAFCGSVVSLTLFIPIGILIFWLVRGVSAGEPLRLVWGAAWSSFSVAFAAAAFAALAALPVAILAVRFPGRASGLVERLAWVGYALPGIVLALSFVFFGANYAPWAYQTLGVLILAYIMLYLPQAVGATRAALLQIRPSVEEAAQSLGRSPLNVMATVTAPLARRGILAGAGLVFLTTMKELPATLLLSPIGFTTLATSVWNATSEAFFARAAAPALLLILVSAIPMYLLVIREKEK